MAVNYSATLKNDRMQAVLNRFDGGSGNAAIEICSTGYAVVLATIPLDKPSFTLASGVLTLANAPKSETAADNGGVAAVARIRDLAGTVWLSGLTVGVGSGDLQLSNLQIVQNQEVTLESGTIAHAL